MSIESSIPESGNSESLTSKGKVISKDKRPREEDAYESVVNTQAVQRPRRETAKVVPGSSQSVVKKVVKATSVAVAATQPTRRRTSLSDSESNTLSKTSSERSTQVDIQDECEWGNESEDDQPYPEDDAASDFEDVYALRVEWKRHHPLAAAGRLYARMMEKETLKKGVVNSQTSRSDVQPNGGHIFVTGQAPTLESVSAVAVKEFCKNVRKYNANNKFNATHPSNMLTRAATTMLKIHWDHANMNGQSPSFEEAKNFPAEVWLTRMSNVVNKMTNTSVKPEDIKLTNLKEVDKWGDSCVQLIIARPFFTEEQLTTAYLNGLDSFPDVRAKVEDEIARITMDRGGEKLPSSMCLGIAMSVANVAREHSKERPKETGNPKPAPETGNPKDLKEKGKPKWRQKQAGAEADKTVPAKEKGKEKKENPNIANVKCFVCGKLGHYASTCVSKK